MPSTTAALDSWKRWVRAIWALLFGALLADIGFFATMLIGPWWFSVLGKGLIALSFVPLGYYLTSGVNRHIWSLRDTLDETEKQQLQRLRAIGVGITVLLFGAVAGAFLAMAVGLVRGQHAQNIATIAAFALSFTALAGGVWVRVSEYRLYKRASQ